MKGGTQVYIPPLFAHDTVLPEAIGRDLQFQVEMIEERWRRFYPEVDYYARDHDFGIAPADVKTGSPAPVAPGGVTKTGYDRLWGEMVDSRMAADQEWQQPHLSGGKLDATTESEHFTPDSPYPLRARVQTSVKERDLKAYGFDDIRDIIATIPASFFDRIGVYVHEGDMLVWDGNEYMVIQDAGSGWWKNSNIRLFRVLNCEHRRRGS